MLYSSLVIFVFSCSVTLTANASGSFSSYTSAHTHNPCRAPPPQCPSNDNYCKKSLAAYEALRTIYAHLDDNHDGKVDKAESQEFVRDELRYEDDATWRVRQTSLLGDDNVMTVEELWCDWVDSEAHNWTQADMVEWLVEEVGLPQYKEAFERAGLDGNTLPLLGSTATGSIDRTLLDSLGVRTPLHRQKLALKAIDVVLFGCPRKLARRLKDLALLVATIMIMLGSYVVVHQRRYAKSREAALQSEMEALQNAEESLSKMRKQLDDAEEHKQTVLQQKNLLELKLKLRDRMNDEQEAANRAKRETLEQHGANSREVINQLHEEIAQLNTLLRQAENQLDSIQFSSNELQFWLQLTYELELEHFSNKKRLAEFQFQQVKESCEKIRKRRNAFFGSMRIAHGDILTSVDERVAEARKTLEEVIADATERSVRWAHIQKACGVDIIANAGLQTLLSQERLRMSNANPAVSSSATNGPNGSNPTLADSSSLYSLRALHPSNALPSAYTQSVSSSTSVSASSIPPSFQRRSTPVDDHGGLWLSMRPPASSIRREEESRLFDPAISTQTEDKNHVSSVFNANAGCDDVTGEASASSSNASTCASSTHSVTPHADFTGSNLHAVNSLHSTAAPLRSNASQSQPLPQPQASSSVSRYSAELDNSQASNSNACATNVSSEAAHVQPLRRKLGAFHASFRLASRFRGATANSIARCNLTAPFYASMTQSHNASDEQSNANAVTNTGHAEDVCTGLSHALTRSGSARSHMRIGRTVSYDSSNVSGELRRRKNTFANALNMNSFDVAGPAKMKKELDGLMLDAAGAFVKPLLLQKNGRLPHELPTLTEQRSTLTRLPSTRSYPNSILNAGGNLHTNTNGKTNGKSTVNSPADSQSASSADSDNTEFRSGSHENLTEKGNVKSWVFHWRAKTKLAQSRRRSTDKPPPSAAVAVSNTSS